MNALIDLWRSPQEYLFHIVESDDLVLEQSQETPWFQVIKQLFQCYGQCLDTAVKYYQALFEFNRKGTTDHRKRKKTDKSNERKEDATLRLLFARPTVNPDHTEILFQTPLPPATTPAVDKNKIKPGQVPQRLAGRQPKDFFSLFTAFCGTQAMGMDATPENVYNNLRANPSFARACNFTQPSAHTERQTDIPSLRKIEQFDQIMTENGLWSEAKNDAIEENFRQNLIHPEKNIVHDTTHHLAFSGFETVKYSDKNEKPCKKSQSHLTKKCFCPRKEDCPHSWELSDEGAGTVVKKHNVYHRAHKSTIIGLPDQGIPIISQAMTDSAGHDSTSIIESMDILAKRFPEVAEAADNLLDDSAADDPKLKKLVEDKFNIRLRCHINPRRRKTLKGEDLPKSMASLSPTGTLRCSQGYEMDYQAKRKYVGYYYGPPRNQQGEIRCYTCPVKSQCCHRDNTDGRHVTIPLEKLPAVSGDDPQMAKRFRKIMKKRPAVERMIYRLKCILGDRYLSKRGNYNYQAFLDKAMLAFHFLLRQ